MFADLSTLPKLDWPLRRDLCGVLMAFGELDFDHVWIRSTFESADGNTHWLYPVAPTPRERLEEALNYAKPGPLTLPRTPSERRVALFLISQFAGEPTNLQSTLEGLDSTRAALLGRLVTSYANGRFTPNDCAFVRDFFCLESLN